MFRSLVLFKSVSKRCSSLIKDAINVTFRRNPDPPSGIFLEKRLSYDEPYFYDFAPLSNRIPNYTFGPEEDGNYEMLHSCNGLLLCRTHSSLDLFVYNPSITNMFKVLPEPNIKSHYDKDILPGGVKMAFDPTKSPHYKVIYAELVPVKHHMNKKMIQLHTFSSETGNWSLCAHQFHDYTFECFGRGVYWNDAIYWQFGEQGKIYKLDIMNEHPVLTPLRTPFTFDLKDFYGYMLFESRGCLLLFGKDNAHSQHFTIYEKKNVYSEWSLKYKINHADIINPFPKRWSNRQIVFCIVLGEREEDSFLVMILDEKFVQYKIVSKKLSTIYDPEDISDSGEGILDCFQFIPSFANV